MAALDDEQLARVLAAVDRANSEDPNPLELRGETRPKELWHAELVSAWVDRLCESPSPALRIAARAHHIRRWQIPRSEYPEGRSGYLRWRRSLQKHHAREARRLLEDEGFADETIHRVEDLLQKRGLGRDPDVQALEDALCLVFLETQFHEIAERLPEAKLLDVTRKTLAKMSERAIEMAQDLPFDPADRELLVRALDP